MSRDTANKELDLLSCQLIAKTKPVLRKVNGMRVDKSNMASLFYLLLCDYLLLEALFSSTCYEQLKQICKTHVIDTANEKLDFLSCQLIPKQNQFGETRFVILSVSGYYVAT